MVITSERASALWDAFVNDGYTYHNQWVGSYLRVRHPEKMHMVAKFDSGTTAQGSTRYSSLDLFGAHVICYYYLTDDGRRKFVRHITSKFLNHVGNSSVGLQKAFTHMLHSHNLHWRQCIISNTKRQHSASLPSWCVSLVPELMETPRPRMLEVLLAVENERIQHTSFPCAKDNHIDCTWKIKQCWCYCHSAIRQVLQETNELCKIQKWNDQIKLDMFNCADCTILSPKYYRRSPLTRHSAYTFPCDGDLIYAIN